MGNSTGAGRLGDADRQSSRTAKTSSHGAQ